MVGQSVSALQCDGRGDRRAGPGVWGGADVVEGMMIHFCTDADYDVTLEKLAELLRPLLAQPAPAAGASAHAAGGTSEVPAAAASAPAGDVPAASRSSSKQ